MHTAGPPGSKASRPTKTLTYGLTCTAENPAVAVMAQTQPCRMWVLGQLAEGQGSCCNLNSAATEGKELPGGGLGCSYTGCSWGWGSCSPPVLVEGGFYEGGPSEVERSLQIRV